MKKKRPKSVKLLLNLHRHLKCLNVIFNNVDVLEFRPAYSENESKKGF